MPLSQAMHSLRLAFNVLQQFNPTCLRQVVPALLYYSDNQVAPSVGVSQPSPVGSAETLSSLIGPPKHPNVPPRCAANNVTKAAVY